MFVILNNTYKVIGSIFSLPKFKEVSDHVRTGVFGGGVGTTVFLMPFES